MNLIKDYVVSYAALASLCAVMYLIELGWGWLVS
jgi:hypothetical protein